MGLRYHVHAHELPDFLGGGGAGTERETIFERVLCRVSDAYSLELHLDVEEANAAGLRNGDGAYIV